MCAVGDGDIIQGMCVCVQWVMVTSFRVCVCVCVQWVMVMSFRVCVCSAVGVVDGAQRCSVGSCWGQPC